MQDVPDCLPESIASSRKYTPRHSLPTRSCSGTILHKKQIKVRMPRIKSAASMPNGADHDLHEQDATVS